MDVGEILIAEPSDFDFAMRFLFSIFFLLAIQRRADGLRAQRVNRTTLNRIRNLITVKMEKEIPQSDSVEIPAFTRNPLARSLSDELTINDPDAFFQGDMELSERQASRLEAQLQQDAKGFRRKRKIGKEPLYKRWDKRKPISFEFADSIPPATRDRIREALAIWEEQTCIRFQENGPNVDRLEFYDGGGCSSFVGRTGGTQGVSITTPGCDVKGIIAHEVGHALGTFHEQARPDQDRNIVVHYSNIPISRWNNFYPVNEEQADTFGLPYDAGSVMHYGAFGFATNPYHPTISTIDSNWRSTIGQRAGPSFVDVLGINVAYRCAESCVRPLKCRNGGYQNPNRCDRCICPSGFGGILCDDVEWSSCGQKLSLNKTAIFLSSPNFPNGFPQNVDCLWLLVAPEEGKVQMEFVERFDYECTEPCDLSFVEIKRKRDFRPAGYRLCCGVLPKERFISESSQMVLMHRSNGATSGGFRVKVWADRDPPVTSSILLPVSSSSPPPKTSVRTFPVIFTTAIPTTIQQITTTTPEITTVGNEIPVEWTFEPIFSLATPSPTLSSFRPSFLSTTTALPSENKKDGDCICGDWSEWMGECSQQCGGCGRRVRSRQCSSEECRKVEKRVCNLEVCPSGTNFLLNNGEFHLLFNGCCVGLFERSGQCAGLDEKGDPFLHFLYKLLRPEDTKNSTRSVVPIPD